MGRRCQAHRFSRFFKAGSASLFPAECPQCELNEDALRQGIFIESFG